MSYFQFISKHGSVMQQKPRKAVSVYTAANKVQMVRGGADYFSLLHRLINDARHHLHLQTYIFDADETGIQVAEALMQAARRGVKVYVLADGYASQKMTRELIARFKESGVLFRWFQPLLRSRYFYFGRRLHHKIVVADGIYGLTGGVNISNRYNDMPGVPAWMDWAVFTEGEVSAELYYVCLEYWNRSGWGKKKRQVIIDEAPRPPHTGQCLARIRQNDWVRRKTQVTRTYLEMFAKARRHIIIMSSYFLPGRKILKMLAAAARRGVQVKVIAAERSDIWVTKYAERYLYRWLFQHGVQLYEYQPRVLHSKMSTCDGKWVTVGSYNVNNISAFASVELNVDVLDEAFATGVEAKLDAIMQQDCHLIDPVIFQKQSHWYHRIWQWACYHFIRVVFNMFTFYFKQRATE
jgi:cardiolipin synthase A/B